MTVWHHIGSVGTSALLLPVVAVHLPPRWRLRGPAAVAAVVAAAATAAGWIALGTGGRWPLGLEPMFPALAVSASLWAADRLHAAWRSA